MLGHHFRGVASQIALGDPQGEVDAGREASSGRDAIALDEPDAAHPLHGRVLLRELVHGAVVRRRRLTVEKARLREKDPRRAEGLKAAGETMAQIFEGETKFVDLDVLAEAAF